MIHPSLPIGKQRAIYFTIPFSYTCQNPEIGHAIIPRSWSINSSLSNQPLQTDAYSISMDSPTRRTQISNSKRIYWARARRILSKKPPIPYKCIENSTISRSLHLLASLQSGWTIIRHKYKCEILMHWNSTICIYDSYIHSVCHHRTASI